MRLLITGAWLDALRHIGEIEGMGHEIRFLQQEKDELPCEADWVEGVICNGLFLYHPIEQFANLRWIQLTSAGFDRVPMEYVREKGIEIHNAKGVYSIPMAEFAVAGVLSVYKKLNQFYEQQKRHEWRKHRDLRELYGSRVVIVGCGSVGTECARRFRAFGCEVTGVDATPRRDEYYDAMQGMDRLDEMLVGADVVVLTVPLTDSTRGLINERRLELIKGLLVNISRGAVVDQKALEKWDGQAVLDVFEEEPLPNMNSLWDDNKVILTPHNSFVGNGNRDRLWSVISNNMED